MTLTTTRMQNSLRQWRPLVFITSHDVLSLRDVSGKADGKNLSTWIVQAWGSLLILTSHRLPSESCGLSRSRARSRLTDRDYYISFINFIRSIGFWHAPSASWASWDGPSRGAHAQCEIGSNSKWRKALKIYQWRVRKRSVIVVRSVQIIRRGMESISGKPGINFALSFVSVRWI